MSRLTVTPLGDLVRRPKFVLPDTASLAQVARAMTIAGSKGVAIVSAQGAFVGLVDPALLEVVQDEEGPLPVAAVDLIDPRTVKVPETAPLSDVVSVFQKEDWSLLPVVSDANPHLLVGIVRARDAFRRAAFIADAQRREELGLVRGD